MSADQENKQPTFQEKLQELMNDVNERLINRRELKTKISSVDMELVPKMEELLLKWQKYHNAVIKQKDEKIKELESKQTVCKASECKIDVVSDCDDNIASENK